MSGNGGVTRGGVPANILLAKPSLTMPANYKSLRLMAMHSKVFLHLETRYDWIRIDQINSHVIGKFLARRHNQRYR